MTHFFGKIVSPLQKPPGDQWHRLLLLLTVVAASMMHGFYDLRAQTTPLPYKNPNLAVEVRVADLIGRMTDEEKARQLDMYYGCESLLHTNQYTGRTHAIPDADFDPQMAEKNLGTSGIGSIHDLYPRPALYNRVQSWVIRSNRLGIPALFIEEGLHGYMDHGETVFPRASTWRRLGILNSRGRRGPPSPPKPVPTVWT